MSETPSSDPPTTIENVEVVIDPQEVRPIASKEKRRERERERVARDERELIGVKTSSCTATKDDRGMSNFLVISISYLAFTLTDGALRMVVLFTAYQHQFSPLEIACMFVLYEGLSIFTNVYRFSLYFSYREINSSFQSR